MSNPNEISAIKKEFELERMILFTDAVFAIAITLLIIEIKFPEIGQNESGEQIMKAFQPTLIHFFGFVISFIFIGVMWARHLSIFKHLVGYNNGLIFRNLCFIFFIVCFPFVVSGFTENVRHGFILPVFLYFLNICCTVIAQFAICHYIFKTRKDLCATGNEREKKYLLIQSSYSAGIFVITGVAMGIVYVVSKGNFSSIVFSLYVLPVMMFIARRRLKKYKPSTIVETGKKVTSE